MSFRGQVVKFTRTRLLSTIVFFALFCYVLPSQAVVIKHDITTFAPFDLTSFEYSVVDGVKFNGSKIFMGDIGFINKTGDTIRALTLTNPRYSPDFPGSPILYFDSSVLPTSASFTDTNVRNDSTVIFSKGDIAPNATFYVSFGIVTFNNVPAEKKPFLFTVDASRRNIIPEPSVLSLLLVPCTLLIFLKRWRFRRPREFGVMCGAFRPSNHHMKRALFHKSGFSQPSRAGKFGVL